VSDRESVAKKTLDRRTRRLLRHLSLVGACLEDRLPARERLTEKIGDLAPFCLPQADADSSARAGGNEPGRAA
jgi:hypothetical protein